MIYRVRHSTKVKYAAPVAHARFNLRLEPARWPGQRLIRYALTVAPDAEERADRNGPYWVVTTRLGFARPLQALELLSEFTIEVAPGVEPGEGQMLRDLRAQALAARDLSSLAPAPYLFASRLVTLEEAIGQWAAPLIVPARGIVSNARAVMAAVHGEFAYRPGATTSMTPPAEAFARREGVCQDFAHVMIIALRCHGIPAAYASGYLRTNPPPGRERLVGADAMHAWVNVWCGPDLGWIGFDPTNNCLAREDHILIGMGRDYADVAPVDGVFIGHAPQSMRVAVDVVPVEAEEE